MLQQILDFWMSLTVLECLIFGIGIGSVLGVIKLVGENFINKT